MVLLFLASAILFGTALDYALKKYPFLQNTINVIDRDDVIGKIDINRASFEELVSVPYIGEYTAKNIMAYRKQKGMLRSIEELKKIKGIKEKNYQKFIKYLKISQ